MEAPQAGWMCAKAGGMKNSRKKRLLLWAGGAVLFFGVLCFGLIQYRVYSLSAPYRVAEEEAPEAEEKTKETNKKTEKKREKQEE